MIVSCNVGAKESHLHPLKELLVFLNADYCSHFCFLSMAASTWITTIDKLENTIEDFMF